MKYLTLGKFVSLNCFLVFSLLEVGILNANAASDTTKSYSLCERKNSYNLDPRIKAAFTVINRGIMKDKYWKEHLAISKIYNCLDIRFANLKDSEAAAYFDAPNIIRQQKYPILISPSLKSSDPVLLGNSIIHEATHALYRATLIAKIFDPAHYKSVQELSCGNDEARAYLSQFYYIKNLSKQDKQKLDNLLQNPFVDDITFRAWEINNFIQNHASDKKLLDSIKKSFVLDSAFYQKNKCF